MIETKFDVTPPGQSHGLSNAAHFPPRIRTTEMLADRIRDCGKQEMVQLSLGNSFAFGSRKGFLGCVCPGPTLRQMHRIAQFSTLAVRPRLDRSGLVAGDLCGPHPVGFARVLDSFTTCEVR